MARKLWLGIRTAVGARLLECVYQTTAARCTGTVVEVAAAMALSFDGYSAAVARTASDAELVDRGTLAVTFAQIEKCQLVCDD